MTFIFAKKLNRLALVVTAAVLVNGMMLQRTYAQEVNLDTLCQKFPFNSRCEGYTSPSQTEDAATESQDPEIIKLKLDTSGSDNEWIRIEVNKNTVKLLHTTRAKTGFSRVVNGVLRAVSPIPVPGLNFHKWYDHPTTRVAFDPDSCNGNSASQNTQPGVSLSCTITGTDTVIVPEGMDIRSGRFTLEYTEGDLLRSITFRIPAKDSRIAETRNDTMSQNLKSLPESSR